MSANAPNAASLTARATRFIAVWGLCVLLVALIVLFSALKPNTFPTYFNFQAIVSTKSIQAIVSLAAMIPIAANRFDLSVAFVLGLSQVLTIGLQGMGVPWPLVVVLMLTMGGLVGLFNGFLVAVIGIDSFIATLGTGTVLLGLNQWYTGGQQVVANMSDSFIALSGKFLGMPLPAIYVLMISVVLWIVLEFLPVGRFIYVLGANPRAAELNGISERKYVTGALVAAGVLAAWAGVVLQAQLQVGESSVGEEYLLPAFTAALLGATAIRPGRVNVWGTVVAVAVLGVTFAGLSQLGAPFFVESLFNGVTLIVAVGLAVTASKRRVSAGKGADAANIADAQAQKTGAAAAPVQQGEKQ